MAGWDVQSCRRCKVRGAGPSATMPAPWEGAATRRAASLAPSSELRPPRPPDRKRRTQQEAGAEPQLRFPFLWAPTGSVIVYGRAGLQMTRQAGKLWSKGLPPRSGDTTPKPGCDGKGRQLVLFAWSPLWATGGCRGSGFRPRALISHAARSPSALKGEGLGCLWNGRFPFAFGHHTCPPSKEGMPTRQAKSGQQQERHPNLE